jgi:diguanylate cyclase (GGDEF)-like protein
LEKGLQALRLGTDGETVSTSLDGPLAEAPVTATRLGSTLGSAIAGRVDEISQRVLLMWRSRSPAAASGATPRVEDDILWTTSVSTHALVDYLLQGELQSREQADAIAKTGKAPLRDTIALAELTKLYLYWREITIATLTEEARRLKIGDDQLGYALAVVRGASDRSVVQMTKQFDAERTRLQDELAAEQARLAHLAYHDALTGLPNRRLFFDRLSHALHLGQRHSSNLGLLFIDVDAFKAINDRRGHLVGDQVLVTAAQRLVASARASDTVARIGGDEFVILCEHLDHGAGHLVALAQRIGVLVSDCMTTDKVPLEVTVSIGITMSTADEDPDALIRQADSAMYAAKQRGPGNYQVWDTRMERLPRH